MDQLIWELIYQNNLMERVEVGQTYFWVEDIDLLLKFTEKFLVKGSLHFDVSRSCRTSFTQKQQMLPKKVVLLKGRRFIFWNIQSNKALHNNLKFESIIRVFRVERAVLLV